MSNKINRPYEFSEEETQLISKNFLSYHDWEKKVFDPIKSRIISHLRFEQDNKCCYCKSELGFDIKDVDIEHIIPKSEYDKFTFYGKNLALSCPACNTKKSTKPVLIRRYNNYPRNGNAFVIVHAHYDDYPIHILIKEECVYVARTSKGSDTIKYCELFRFLDVMEKAKQYQTKKTPIAQLVENIRNADDSDINDLIMVIKDKIENN